MNITKRKTGTDRAGGKQSRQNNRQINNREDESLMKNKTNHKKADVATLHVDETVSLEEQIAQRAHALWHQNGRKHGSDLADWFQAEREVTEWHQQKVRNSA